MFAHEFVRNAFLAGTAIALACGLVGHFVVLRAQVFAGDALTHVAFTGAIAAAAAGIDIRIGLFAATIAVALAIGALGERSSADARFAAAIAVAIIVILLAIARPLLFASVDPAVASARGVPVRALGLVFLALLGATAAEATQAIGALLLLGLLAAPAGAAQRLTPNPYHALGLAAALAVLFTWAGLTISYLIPELPPSSAIIAVACGAYLLTFLSTADLGALRRQITAPVAGGSEN